MLVLSMTLLEVFERGSQQRDDAMALPCVAVMQPSAVIDLDAAPAFRAATVWTQDPDFEGLACVRYWPKIAP